MSGSDEKTRASEIECAPLMSDGVRRSEKRTADVYRMRAKVEVSSESSDAIVRRCRERRHARPGKRAQAWQIYESVLHE